MHTTIHIASVARFTLAACVAALASVALFAGDLNPPPGPVAPTMKTLDEVEARIPLQSVPGGATFEHVVSAPGSYYLTGDLVLTLPISAVFIEADDVTIDLNGFSIVGTGVQTGVLINNGRRNIVIRDGTIRSFAAGVWGINALDVQAINLRVHSMQGQGVFLGDGGVVENCTAANCGDVGLVVGNAGRITNSTSRNNAGSGFGLGAGSVIENCTASSNGFDGVISNGPVAATNLTARGNSLVGLNLGANSTVIGCNASNNGGGGIRVTFNSLVRDCSASGNTEYGIQAVSDCLVLNNVVSFNTGGTGVGIDVFGTRVHVQGNTAINNPVGFRAAMSGNVFLGNVARSNTNNYGAVSVGNIVGPIVNFADLPTNCNPDANRSF